MEDSKKSHYKKLTQYFAEVEFGVLGRDCKNYGICRIKYLNSPHPIRQKKRCCSGIAQIGQLESGGVELKFLRSSLTKKTIQKYFSSD